MCVKIAPEINKRVEKVVRFGGGRAHFLAVLAEEVLDWIVMFDEGRFYHDVAEIFLDAEVSLQHALDNRLIVRDAAGYESEQVIISATHHMALEDLVDLSNPGFEPRKVAAAMLRQRDFGEDRQILTELAHVYQRAVAADVSRLLQPFHTGKTGAWGEADQIRELDVCNTPRVLELGQNLEIDTIELLLPHRQYLKPSRRQRSGYPALRVGRRASAECARRSNPSHHRYSRAPVQVQLCRR